MKAEREIELIKKLMAVISVDGECDDDDVDAILYEYVDVVMAPVLHDTDYGNDWGITLQSGIKLEMCSGEANELYWMLGI